MGVTKCGKPQCNSDGDRRTGGDATNRLVGDEVITLMITLMISLFRRDDLIIADLISACHRRDAFRRSRHLERVIPALVNVGIPNCYPNKCRPSFLRGSGGWEKEKQHLSACN